ncbi:nuclear transport factor 2 family protein [Mucilaginibacter myungsuensis]|uniref:Nuclear transport factor 2 family protein n=1 Tax=Mucilaginibacter myungsuensis TaxID=649104 RepID=A0A929KZF1_9SPHI|nr:nuclear transport factor 2 family protein [Mucilaginibacter myungsuensis]MBE9661694.1 nuclear transport factor 2 family protein [Mucilaginibacter myungsuensis]MDN3597838.1 nuclear transport factor 2 family protein [Mucilaginibacter myungsuensis]
MYKTALALLLSIFTLSAFCQTDEADIKKTITTMFDGMRKGDTAMLAATFHKDMVLQSVGINKDGSTRLVTEKASAFVTSVGKPHTEVYDERITFNDIKIDGPLAMAWTPYKFYVGEKFSHCGVNIFQMMKTTAGWKIIYIVDTRRKDKCVE